MVKNHNIFLYEVYKQQYLEYIENHDIQKVCVKINSILYIYINIFIIMIIMVKMMMMILFIIKISVIIIIIIIIIII